MLPIEMTNERYEMVANQIAARGVRDPRVLAAMRKVPREAFVSDELREFAYEDCPQPISANQTISQPYIVAFMIEAMQLQGGEKVLEIGTGSGYATAVLAEIAGQVYSVERIHTLANQAKRTLLSLGYDTIQLHEGDGTLGWPQHAPYDAIVVTASGPGVPESLLSQLKPEGRLLIPIGPDATNQELVLTTKRTHAPHKSEAIADVRFVPLIGNEGW